MDTILIKPKSKSEFELLTLLLKKMNINSSKLTQEQLEDYGMLHLMNTGDRTKVSTKKIKQILK